MSPRARAVAERLAAAGLDNVTWAASALFAGTAADRLEFGLELLLDGISGLATKR